MEILAGITLTLASLVLLLILVRLLQNELKKVRRVNLATWFLFGGVILFPAMGVLGGIYLIFFH